ncbi:MAG: hypothetical protein J6V44_14925 [Methanobrevibacter sp.]|nr:hypothetical protein [Methanobrevibacter sp.]MBO7692744.1 hypothetical protein [Methanobrevibacter sp.]
MDMRNLTDEETEIYDSWLEHESYDTGESLFNSENRMKFSNVKIDNFSIRKDSQQFEFRVKGKLDSYGKESLYDLFNNLANHISDFNRNDEIEKMKDALIGICHIHGLSTDTDPIRIRETCRSFVKGSLDKVQEQYDFRNYMRDQFNISAHCSKEEFAEEIKKRVGECIDREEYAKEQKDKIFEAIDSYLGISDTNRLLGIHNEIKNLKEKAAKYDELMRIAHPNK